MSTNNHIRIPKISPFDNRNRTLQKKKSTTDVFGVILLEIMTQKDQQLMFLVELDLRKWVSSAFDVTLKEDA